MSLAAVLNLRSASNFSLKELRDTMRSQFVELAVAVESFDLECEYVEDRLNALVRASGTKLPIISGSEIEDEYRSAYVCGYRGIMGCTQADAEDHYDFPSHVEVAYLHAPKAWISQVGLAVGTQDALETQAWYKHCAELEKVST